MDPQDRLLRAGFVPADVLYTAAEDRIVEIVDFGHIRLVTISGSAMTIVHEEWHVAPGSPDTLQLRFIDAGRCVMRQDGREGHLEQGDFAVLDSSRSFSLHYPQPFATRAFMFPCAALGVAGRDLSPLTARPLNQDNALSAFLVPLLGQLSEQSRTLHAQTREALARNVTSILTTLIQESLQDAPLGDVARRSLVRRVKAFIVANLARPELSPQLIAVEHNISVRYLHKLFTSESTTLSRWILQARLAHCRRDLAAETQAPIAAVAHRWGFTSPAHFSRVFRDAYGMSPSAWQAATLAGRAEHDRYAPADKPRS